MVLAPSVDVSLLALRVLERTRSNDWAVLLVPSGQETGLADELARAMGDLGGEAVIARCAGTAEELIQHAAGDTLQVIAVPGSMAEAEWARVDRQRSKLLGQSATVLVVDQATMDRLARHAPNLQSWIGPSVWIVDTEIPSLSPDEIDERLQWLREWSGQSDGDILALAEQGQLPGDPEYAEWLVLLDRGDLLGKGGEHE